MVLEVGHHLGDLVRVLPRLQLIVEVQAVAEAGRAGGAGRQGGVVDLHCVADALVEDARGAALERGCAAPFVTINPARGGRVMSVW